MRKPGTDPDNVQMSDVLCDFCHREWTDDLPVMEGHQGSIICGRCLSVSYSDVVLEGHNTAPEGYTCTMCLEQRKDPAWSSPAYPEAVVCKRCIKLAAGTLEKDKDWGWERPGGKGGKGGSGAGAADDES
jgi:hypothetical protein